MTFFLNDLGMTYCPEQMKQSEHPTRPPNAGKAPPAAEKHAGQKRKGRGSPTSPIRWRWHSGRPAAAGTGHRGYCTTWRRLRRAEAGRDRAKFRMGWPAIVEGLSDTLESPKPKWRPRKGGLRREHAGARSVRIVATDNAPFDPGGLPQHRKRKFKAEGGRSGTTAPSRARSRAGSRRSPADRVGASWKCERQKEGRD
jgi:hypothetical protein